MVIEENIEVVRKKINLNLRAEVVTALADLKTAEDSTEIIVEE